MDLQMVLVKTVIRFFGPKLFDRGYSDTQRSKLYPEFCKRVFGRNLSQFNMLPEAQLQWLLKAISHLPAGQALDVGCGAGLITEFLSDHTPFNWTGFDYAPGAIRSARARNLPRAGKKIEFVSGDLNSLSDLKTSTALFDLLVSIDSLYFVKDLGHSLRDLMKLLKPNGTFICFFVAKAANDAEKKQLSPQHTKLAVALKQLSLNFTVEDFTSMDLDFWKHSLTVAQEMLPEFEKEGSTQIAKGRIFESTKNLTWHRQGLLRRYCYTIKA